MAIDIGKVGLYIQDLRKKKNMTQAQLGERLSISYQAVSKWERGESLPDTAILMELSSILETTVDSILNGGERVMGFNRKICIKDIQKGIDNMSSLGSLIGRENSLYMGFIEGINNRMNLDIEECFKDSFKKEALVAEVIIQNIMNGDYVDLSEIENSFEHDHWSKIVGNYAKEKGII